MATDSDTKAPAGTTANPINPAVIAEVFGGRMLADDFLKEELIPLSSKGESVHRLDDTWARQCFAEIKEILNKNSSDTGMNESNTVNFIILPLLQKLGWTDYALEFSLPYGSRFKFVLDILLFMDEQEKRKKQGSVLVECKRQGIILDGKDSSAVNQILGYLRHADNYFQGHLQWGILTNGYEWQLYYQRAQSVSESYFAVRLDKLFACKNEEEAFACFKIFLLMFCKQSFQPAGVESKTLHQFILQEETLHQQRITDNLAEQIFPNIYEKLAKAIAMNAPDANTDDIRMATLKILFRLLFILFAEDRDLLPLKNDNYKKYSLRHNLRMDIAELASSRSTATYWHIFKSLCNLINNGEPEFDLPKYNGGLFKDDVDLLTTLEISDMDMLEIIRPLSHIGKTYINYKNLDVEELGAIYEQLLSLTVVKGENKHDIVISGYDRKKSGSYYTPRELVNLAIDETADRLYKKNIEIFEIKVSKLKKDSSKSDVEKGRVLAEFDPAHAVLQQKACDPAMGSGYFLVGLIDRLTDQVISAMGQVENSIPEEWNYESPVQSLIKEIRSAIRKNAKKDNYKLNEEHLKDIHIIKRLVLKKCIYGVDKNPMAVELAKLSLWLHTFTVGAPLSFLDHHLKCGDSLFGLRVEDAIIRVEDYPLLALASGAKEKIADTADKMEIIANMPDAEIEQVEESEEIYKEAQKESLKIKKFFSFIHGVEWLRQYKSTAGEKKKIEMAFQKIMQQQFSTTHGKNISAIDAVSDTSAIPVNGNGHKDMTALIEEVLELSNEENFFHWQIEFPEVWKFDNGTAKGGFDIIVGNPPWDRTKLQEVEWFADRDIVIASATTQAKRKSEIKKLRKRNPSLYAQYEKAQKRAKSSLDVTKNSGLYKELNKGDINIYKIFVERTRQLISEEGYISFVIPSAIASDYYSASFFQGLVKNKQLISFYDFENRRAKNIRKKQDSKELKRFFKSVDDRFKFCIFTHTKFANEDSINYGCFLQDADSKRDNEKCFPMHAEDFNLVNPNTGTLPLFRSKRDKDIVTSIYKKHPILDNPNDSTKGSQWKIKPSSMFHATNDSYLFKEKKELEKSGAYSIGDNQYENPEGIWLPLYQGKMYYLHDHRAAKMKRNRDGLHVPIQPEKTTIEEYKNKEYYPEPFFWVKENEATAELQQGWVIAFRNNARSNDSRTFITAILPKAAYQNSTPIIINERYDKKEYLLYANFSSVPFDYVTRTKLHDVNLNFYIVEQLPVIDVPTYGRHEFGNKTAEEVIKDIILKLNYTAYNLQAFAEDLGYKGKPFEWKEEHRLSLMAKLDAVYFILYGITDDDDIEYIYSTFENMLEQRVKLCIDYKNALQNGRHDIVY